MNATAVLGKAVDHVHAIPKQTAQKIETLGAKAQAAKEAGLPVLEQVHREQIEYLLDRVRYRAALARANQFEWLCEEDLDALRAFFPACYTTLNPVLHWESSWGSWGSYGDEEIPLNVLERIPGWMNFFDDLEIRTTSLRGWEPILLGHLIDVGYTLLARWGSEDSNLITLGDIKRVITARTGWTPYLLGWTRMQERRSEDISPFPHIAGWTVFGILLFAFLSVPLEGLSSPLHPISGGMIAVFLAFCGWAWSGGLNTFVSWRKRRRFLRDSPELAEFI
jgi:hypothetical protein